MNKSIVIIGKGPSALRCSKDFIDSHDEVAICGHPVFDGYEHIISNRAMYDFINCGDPNPYKIDRINSLGLKYIINTGGRKMTIPKCIIPYSKITYCPFYRGICLDYFQQNYDLDPSCGIMALHYFLNHNSEYNRISLVGFDLFQKGTKIYYFKRQEASPTLQYLWNRGSYNNNDKITFDSGHNVENSYNYIIDQIKENSNIDFTIYTNYEFEKIDNLTIR